MFSGPYKLLYIFIEDTHFPSWGCANLVEEGNFKKGKNTPNRNTNYMLHKVHKPENSHCKAQGLRTVNSISRSGM